MTTDTPPSFVIVLHLSGRIIDKELSGLKAEDVKTEALKAQ